MLTRALHTVKPGARRGKLLSELIDARHVRLDVEGVAHRLNFSDSGRIMVGHLDVVVGREQLVDPERVRWLPRSQWPSLRALVQRRRLANP